MAALHASATRGLSLKRSKGFAPFKAPRSVSVTVRAEQAGAAAPTKAVPIQMSWEKDEETIRDVFAFAGSAPERVNGRIAMYGWALLLGPELNKHITVADQFGDAWFGIIAFGTLIAFASIVPKLIAGVPLRDLHAAATSANLKSEGLLGQFLSLFDTNLELWAGRLAMLGFVGIVAIEAVKGESFF